MQFNQTNNNAGDVVNAIPIPIKPNRTTAAWTAVQLAVWLWLIRPDSGVDVREAALDYGRDITNEADIDAVLACIDLDKLKGVGR